MPVVVPAAVTIPNELIDHIQTANWMSRTLATGSKKATEWAAIALNCDDDLIPYDELFIPRYEIEHTLKSLKEVVKELEKLAETTPNQQKGTRQ